MSAKMQHSCTLVTEKDSTPKSNHNPEVPVETTNRFAVLNRLDENDNLIPSSYSDPKSILKESAPFRKFTHP